MKKYASLFFLICYSFLFIEYFAVHTLAKDSSTSDSYGGPLIRCIKSPLSKGSQNYYEDLSGCKDSANWTIASQSEQHFGESCGGPNAQSLPINQKNSNLKLNWQKNGPNKLAVNLKSDFVTNYHPCPGKVWNWFAFMNHISHGGRTHPRVDTLVTSARVFFDTYVITGEARALMGIKVWWKLPGKAKAVAHEIEVNFYTQPTWGRIKSPFSEVIYHSDFDKTWKEDKIYIALDGRFFGSKSTMALKEEKEIEIHWGEVLNHLLKKGLITAPEGGWSNTQVETTLIASEAVTQGHKRSLITDLWFSDFKIISSP